MASILSSLSSLFKGKKQTTPAPTPTPSTTTQTPSYLQSALTDSGSVDPAGLAKRTTQAIGNMTVPDQTATINSAQKAVNALSTKDQYGTSQESPEQKIGQAAIDAFKSQVSAAQKQAQNQAMDLQTKSESTQAYLTKLSSLGATADTAMADMTSTWNKLATQGDQYIKDAATDMARITGQIKSMTEQYAREPQNALVGSIVAGVTGFLESNKSNERAIAERYGTASQEYQDYQASKRISIGTMVGDLTSKAQERASAILNSGLQAFSTAAQTLATNVNWVRQKSMETANNIANSKQSWYLSTSSYKLALAQAEGTATSDLANAIDASAVTAVDATPLLSLLGELQETQQTRIASEKAAKRQARQQALQESYAMGLGGWGVY